jgi:hypothetical protein
MSRFAAGQIVTTFNISSDMIDIFGFHDFVTKSLKRHLAADWGDVDAFDKEMNDEAMVNGERMVSAYSMPREFLKVAGTDVKVWIITESDRSATTVLYPSEY